ncbi:MAG: hypothetical protein ACTSRZ_10455 [Promethearchaeota archaeon]
MSYKNMKDINTSEFDKINQPDEFGVYKYRFKWRNILEYQNLNIDAILMQYKDKPKFYYILKSKIKDENKNQKSSMTSTSTANKDLGPNIREIFNANIHEELISMANSFRVIGARGRHIIIGKINLKKYGFPDNEYLILVSLKDWKRFFKDFQREEL